MDGTTRAQPQGGYAHATTWAFNRNGNPKSRAGNLEPHAHGGSVTNFDLFDDFWCPACRTINAIDLRALDRHPDAAVTSLIPSLSCRSCRPNAPFAELVQLSRTSIADEMREEHRRRVLGE